MMTGLEIIFSNGTNTLSLFYRIYDWPAAKKWYGMIKTAINNVYMLSDTSFVISEESEKDLVLRINLLISQVNETYNSSIQLINSYSDLNFLHQQVALVSNCMLWAKINDAIHAYEQYKNQISSSEPRINAYFQFIEDTQIPLEQNDYLFFKADRDYGDLCMNYSYKGKHWLELASDNDVESLTDGQLQPEDRIKAGGYLTFRAPSPTPFFRLSNFVKWYTDNVGLEITPDMAIGYLLVGKLIMPTHWTGTLVQERAEWTTLLSNYKVLTEVKIIDVDDSSIDNYLKISKMIS